MRSTLTPAYIGVDLTSRASRVLRPSDVCGLTPVPGGTFSARFWTWLWDPGESLPDVAEILAEIRRSRVTLIDGPQGLALPPRTQRACEERLRTPGKTGFRRPPPAAPYAEYIHSSLDLFAALHREGQRLSPRPGEMGCGEVYPGALWKALAPSLPSKTTPDGLAIRRELLSTIGVAEVPHNATHDQLDAAVAAVAAAALDGAVPFLQIELVGDDLSVDTSDGSLREGPIVMVSVVSDDLRERLGTVVRRHQQLPSETVAEFPARPANDLAEVLLSHFLEAVRRGRPTVASYSWLSSRVFPQSRPTMKTASASEVVRVAARTSRRHVPKLGDVALDTFVVGASTREPGTGHWRSASYTPTAWKEVFQSARVLHGNVNAPWEQVG